MEDQNIDSEKTYNGKFPTFLLVLLILTSVNVLYQIYTSTVALIQAEEELGNARVHMEQAIENSGMDIDEIPDWIMTGINDFFNNFIDNLFSYELYSLFFYLIVGVSVLLMFKLKKSGLYLYIVMQIIGVFDYFFFFGTNFVSVAMAVGTGILALIFILLYRANKKHLH